MTLDGRVVVPGERWVTGEESRRLVHELRAQVDAVAVGGGTARADRPRLDARDVETPKGQPRRLVFWHGPAARRPRPRAPERAARRGARARWRPRASSRCCSKAGRRSPRPSSRPTSSTSCSSSWRRPGGRRAVADGFATLTAHAVAASRPGRWVPMCSSKPMSTTPETDRTDDQLVTHLSHWLTRQIGNDELLRKVQEIDTRRAAAGRPRRRSRSCSSSCTRRTGRTRPARGGRPRDGRDARLRRLTSRACSPG